MKQGHLQASVTYTAPQTSSCHFLMVQGSLQKPWNNKMQPETMSCFLARTVVDNPQMTHCTSGHFEDAVEHSLLACTGSSALELYRESSAGKLTRIHRQCIHDDIVDVTSIPGASSCRSDVRKVSIRHSAYKDQDVAWATSNSAIVSYRFLARGHSLVEIA